MATCHPVMLEVLYSARSTPDYQAWRSALARLPLCPIGPAEWARALEVYDLLAQQGPLHQRQVSHHDLLIAAAAEAACLPVWHYDEDYDRIAQVTGQECVWLRSRGSLR